jgi:ABC-type sugar transport system ATPase subunit
VGAPLAMDDAPRALFGARSLATPAHTGHPAAAAARLGLAPPGPARAASLGVRVEDLVVVDAGAAPDAAAAGAAGAEATVEVVEPLGSDALVHLQVGGHTLTARIESGRAPRPGERLRVRARPGRLHYFDGAGGRLA